jgi:hypothetical protein
LRLPNHEVILALLQNPRQQAGLADTNSLNGAEFDPRTVPSVGHEYRVHIDFL